MGVPLYLGLVTGILYVASINWHYDDPFITFRYVYNLAHGLGFVYNPGERVLATTSPLFVLLLASFHSLWSDIPQLANLIGALSLALGGLFLSDLAQTWGTPIVGWVSLLIYPTFPLLLITLGSEIPLYLAFCLGAYTLYARQNHMSSAVFAALATLTRPDGVLVPLALLIGYLARTRTQIPWKAILLYLGLTLPWFIFAWGHFGSPLPATLAAKQHQGSMAISSRFAPRLLAIVRNYSHHWYFWPTTALTIGGIVFMVLRSRHWSLIFLWIAQYITAYMILGVSGHHWYYAPLVPGLIVLFSLGITAICTQFPFISQQIHRQLRPQYPLIISFFVILLLLWSGNNLRQYMNTRDSRFPIYREVGKWLRVNTPTFSKVGTLEAGIIGYYAQRPMIDFTGLLQTEVAAQLTMDATYADAARWAIERYQPEYLVLQAGMFPEIEQDYTQKNCSVVQHFSGARYNYQSDLLVYECNPNYSLKRLHD